MANVSVRDIGAFQAGRGEVNSSLVDIGAMQVAPAAVTGQTLAKRRIVAIWPKQVYRRPRRGKFILTRKATPTFILIT